MLTKDGIHTLPNIVVGDPTCVDLFPWSCTIQKFIVSNVTQVKERSYYNQHDINQFILSLTIEIFRCLHKHANVLLHDYANAIWGFKRLKSPPFFVLIKKIQLHAKDANASILSWTIMIGLIISQLPPFQNTPSIIMINLLHVIDRWNDEILTFNLC